MLELIYVLMCYEDNIAGTVGPLGVWIVIWLILILINVPSYRQNALDSIICSVDNNIRCHEECVQQSILHLLAHFQ